MTDDVLREYSYITTVHDVPTPEGILSAGAIGSIVMVYPEHRAYLVEFEAPWHVIQLGHHDVLPNGDLNASLLRSASASADASVYRSERWSWRGIWRRWLAGK
jgi:hypothetical protein